MKRWICAVALVALAGCSAVSSVPPHPQTLGAAIKASGGAFSGGYAGTYTGGFSCISGAHFNFSGSGIASFIHRSTESGSMTVTSGMSCAYNGMATLTSTFHPSNTITIGLGPSGAPCNFRTRIVGVPFTVTSGTGKFRNATGSGKVKFTCGSGYTDKWSGTITF